MTEVTIIAISPILQNGSYSEKEICLAVPATGTSVEKHKTEPS